MLKTKYNYIYKTTNLINDKVYVGKHCSNKNPQKDKYLGLQDNSFDTNIWNV